MAGVIGMEQLVSLAVSGVIGIFIVEAFVPLLANADAIVRTLVGLISVVLAYVIIRALL